jgi:predicted GIY-YIG superfamily endonuclease
LRTNAGKVPSRLHPNKRYRGKLYVGVTSALYNRVADHKNEWLDGFTKGHDLKS